MSSGVSAALSMITLTGASPAASTTARNSPSSKAQSPALAPAARLHHTDPGSPTLARQQRVRRLGPRPTSTERETGDCGESDLSLDLTLGPADPLPVDAHGGHAEFHSFSAETRHIRRRCI